MTESTTLNFTATVSSAEIARNFGRYKELAQRGPVAITSHGRGSVVLLSADEYARLKALDDRQSLLAAELPDYIKDALDTAAPPTSARVYDDEMKS